MPVELIQMSDKNIIDLARYSMNEYAKSMVENNEYKTRKKPDKLARDEVNSYFNGKKIKEDEYLYNINCCQSQEKVGRIWFSLYEEMSYNSVFLVWIDIFEKYRGQGLARQTLIEIEEIYKELNVAYVDLNVFANNHSAIKCYKSIGYKITKEKIRGNAKKTSRYNMRKYLLPINTML